MNFFKSVSNQIKYIHKYGWKDELYKLKHIFIGRYHNKIF